MAHDRYLEYEEYLSFGGTLPLPAFLPLEFRCRKRIDYLTASRIQRMAEVPMAVKICMMSLIGIENSVGVEAQIEKPVVTSFSNDGYSESYGKALGASEAESSMRGIIRTSLYGETDDHGVPLLYRGLDA